MFFLFVSGNQQDRVKLFWCFCQRGSWWHKLVLISNTSCLLGSCLPKYMAA